MYAPSIPEHVHDSAIHERGGPRASAAPDVNDAGRSHQLHDLGDNYGCRMFNGGLPIGVVRWVVGHALEEVWHGVALLSHPPLV